MFGRVDEKNIGQFLCGNYSYWKADMLVFIGN